MQVSDGQEKCVEKRELGAYLYYDFIFSSMQTKPFSDTAQRRSKPSIPLSPCGVVALLFKGFERSHQLYGSIGTLALSLLSLLSLLSTILHREFNMGLSATSMTITSVVGGKVSRDRQRQAAKHELFTAISAGSLGRPHFGVLWQRLGCDPLLKQEHVLFKI